MTCPRCAHAMADVTSRWHTFPEAEGAEYLATYGAIWHCPHCTTILSTDEDEIVWLMEPDDLPAEVPARRR